MNYDKHLYGMAASDPLEYAARRNAGRKLGFLMHATVYVIVNLGLMLLAWSQGRHWAVYPALFWGIGLACHAASVWLRSPNSSFSLFCMPGLLMYCLIAIALFIITFLLFF